MQDINDSKPLKSKSNYKDFLQKCKYHPKQTCDILHLSKNVTNPRICIVCAQENNIPYSEMISLSMIYSANPMSTFQTYPVLTDPQSTSRMKSILGTINSYLKQVEVFYDDLIDQINASINKAKEKTRSKLIALANAYNATVDAVKNSSQMDKLQKILQEKSKNDDDLIAFIQQACKNAFKNTELIQSNYNNYIKIKDQFSITEPTSIKKEITQLIEAINLFSYSKPSNLTPISLTSLKLIPSNKYGDSQQNCLIEKDQSGRTLITHKGLSPEYAQCYLSEPLINQVKYIIRVQILQNSNNNAPYFTIGLIDQLNKDTMYVGNEELCYHQSSGMQLSKIIKGKKLHSGNQNIFGQKNAFEFRIHLQNKFLRMANYPEYSSVAELQNKEDIQLPKTYYLAFHVHYKGDAIRILDMLTVTEFDQKMN